MTHTLQSQLDLVEQQFNEVAAILAADDAGNMASASEALQSLAVELVQLIGPATHLRAAPAADIERIKALSTGMRLLCDNLSRRAAYVNQALKIVVPTPAKSTYSSPRSPFGGVIQQSGEFNVLAA
jgi:hypothetical protein